MKQITVPRIGMRVLKTAVAVVLSYLVFVPFHLFYREELGGVLGQTGPLYACIAALICLQSTVDQSVQLGISRLIGIGVGGVLGIATLLLGPALDNPWIKAPVLGLVCVAGLWLCLLLKRPGACVMACILPCVILITGVTGVTRYHYAVARIVETLVGLFIALGVNAVLPDLRPEPGKGAPDLRVEVKNSTKKLCVIGDPVGHSKSPLLHNTMLKALGLEGKSLTLLVNIEDMAKSAAANRIEEDLESAGLRVTVERLAWEDYVKALKRGQFDLYLAEVYLTADFDLTSLISPQGELNYGGWNDAAIPGLLDNVRRAQGDERVERMTTLLRYLNQNAPIAPICFREGTVLTQYDRVENLSPVQGNVFSNLSQWTVK